jgi:RNA polymerase sigma-54 factor
MKQGLQLRVSQHLALTPQLQQAIRLLQLSTLDLNAEIEQALRDNPLLERDEPDDTIFMASAEPSAESSAESLAAPADEAVTINGASTEDDEGWGIGPSGGARGDDEDSDDFGETLEAAIDLRAHLRAQLLMTPMPEVERILADLIVEALDDDGYLTQPLEEILDLLPAGIALDREILSVALNDALRRIQELDPPGVGARNVRECLALQLGMLPSSPEQQLALAIVDQHLEHLAARDFSRIKKALRCTDDELRAAREMIRMLNPHPGAQYTPLDTRYVVPDVTVKKRRGNWVVSLNSEAMPRLRINRIYADILRRGQHGAAASALSSQLQEAKWLIKNVQQRFDTILRVSQAIVDRQRAFFDHGPVAMRPLILREIAETVGLHESTISRVTTQKYLASPRGIFELKYFFGSHVATEAGGAASSTAIRALIKQLVDAEDGKKPLTDARIAEILGEQGIVVARRTVAKYRESLHIPPITLRKRL